MQLFADFREDGWNTYYDGRHTPAYFDVKMAVLCFSGTVAMAVLIIVVIGTRSKKRLSTFIRLFLNLHPGIVILVCLTGKNWIDSHIHTHCEFSSRASPMVDADVAINVGLKSMNVTMAGYMNMTENSFHTLSFNEHFNFEKVSSLADSLQISLRLGKPSVILYVLDYLRQDDGDLRWAREMRMAGHFVYIMLCSSLASWVVAQLVLAFVVVRGAFFLALTGLLMAGSSVLYHGLRPGMKLTIPFEDSFMSFHYGWCFWLCGVAGVTTVSWSLAILIGHCLQPEKMSNSFHVDAYRLDSYSPSSTLQRHSPLVLPTPYQERKKSSGIFYENKAFTFEELHLDKTNSRNLHHSDSFPDGVNFCEMNTMNTIPPEDAEAQGEGSFTEDSASAQVHYSNRNSDSEIYFDSESFDTLESDQHNRTVVDIEGSVAAADDRSSDC